MLKIMRSNKLKRFIAVLFILLSVFSMCFSVAAKAEAVTLGIGTIVVLGTMLAACGIKFASSADTTCAVVHVWNVLTDGMKSIVGALAAMCEGYQKARRQIPFAVFDSFSKVFDAVFPSSAATGGTFPFTLPSLPMADIRNGSYFATTPSQLVDITVSSSGQIYLPPTEVRFFDGGKFTFSYSSVYYSSSNSFVVQVFTECVFNDGYGFVASTGVQSSDFSGAKFWVNKSDTKTSCKFFMPVFSPWTSASDSSFYFYPATVSASGSDSASTCLYPAGFRADSFIINGVSYDRSAFVTHENLDLSFDQASFFARHYAASLQKNEDVLNYGVSRNPALTTNPDCTVPQAVDGSKDVYMDIPALKDTSLDDLITKNPADVATPADTKVENPTLVEGADTNVGGDVTVPEDASWLDKILAWLKALLDGILSIPGVISNGIAGVIEGIKAIPAAFAKWFESLIEGIKALGLSFVDWISQLKKMFVSLFEPTVSLEDAFASLKADFQAKIPYDRLSSSLTGFFDWLRGIGEKPPVFYITLYGNDYAIAPFDYLHAYRPYWIAFETFLMWAWFSLRVWKRIPSMIGGL